MAKNIDVDDLKKKADKAQKKIEKDKEKAEKEKALKIEQKAQELAQWWIDRMPQTLEDAVDEGKKQICVFKYDIIYGSGDYTGTAISERTLELVREYCREQGIRTFMEDGQWNSPGMVHEYALYVDLT
ncbi:MAG: hypothetical protein WDZ40_00280 [Candidatus Spechtbacterales bacterium]